MTQRTRIKICGVTRSDDATMAVRLGVDAIGMILYANSPRTVSLARAQEVRKAVPAFVSLVGVFVDAPLTQVKEISQLLQLSYVQLHGDESRDYAAELDLPYIKAVRAKNPEQISDVIKEHASAHAILLDPYVDGLHGGTGKVLDGDLWPNLDAPHGKSKALVLAGGLSPINVRQRIKELSPFAVDLNSGLETAPGHKSSELMRQAISQVRLADQAKAS